jgi:hypothetical protein
MKQIDKKLLRKFFGIMSFIQGGLYFLLPIGKTDA